MVEFKAVLEQRRSVRRFKGDVVPREKLNRLLECAVMAPSAGNVQPWRFLVLSERTTREKLVRAALNQRWMLEAPVMIVVLADLARAASAYGDRGRELYAVQDTAAAVQNLLLAAVDMGLGACWVGAFSEAEASRSLGLPDYLRPVALVPVGVPAGASRGPGRRPFSEVVDFPDD